MKTVAKQGILIFLIIVVAVTAIDFIGSSYYSEDKITGTVLDKERVVKDQSSYYLIYTDTETFTIQDSTIKWRFDSSDVYGHIEEGKTYEFTVFGWRSGFFSMYRNIISYEEV